jgi:ribosomal protein S18 acetylase RimI-like enzyme
MLNETLLNKSLAPDPFLVELAEESTYAYQMTYACLPGGESGADERLSWYRTGLPGEFFNGILQTNFPEEGLEENIRAALAPFQQRSLPMRWYIGPSSRPAELEQGLQRCGLSFGWRGPALAIDLNHLRAPEKQPAGLVCEAVESPAALAEWIELWVGGAPLEVQQRLSWVYTVSEFGKTLDVRLYLGKIEGRAVATAAIFYGSRAAAVKHVSTLPEYRRRGIASALTVFSLEDARRAGCRYAALTSSPEGYPVYRKLGFEEVCTIERYVWMPNKQTN